MLQRQHFLSLCTWYTTLLIVVTCNDYKGFDDTILFKINWSGPDEKLLEEAQNLESVVITTHHKEKYKCLLPNIDQAETENETKYDGLAPLDLVSTLFSSATCSYRIESYWTYEVCHGSYVKQFHEEREGKSIKVQEYYLGKWTKEKTEMLSQKLADAEKRGEKYPTIRIDGVNLPYLEIEMTDGTFCDLNGAHRITNVQYVCYPHGKNEVYSLKETSTCNYEVVILTPTLCVHPSFNPKEAKDNTINCVPLNDAPPKPRSLLMMEVENMKKILEVSKSHKQPRVSVVKFNPKDGTIKTDILTNEMIPDISKVVEAALGGENDDDLTSTSPIKTPLLQTKADNLSPVLDFLEGKNCLTGGTGWWKYEFCYGRYVRQFHVDKNGETSLMLGYFNEDAHKEWLKENPQKRPKKLGVRTHITHFYQGGSICDESGEKRQTEVQLKCLENSTSMSKVSLFLMEPKICHYILGVESPLICEIIEKADEDGLVTRKSVIASATEENSETDSILDEGLRDTIENILN